MKDGKKRAQRCIDRFDRIAIESHAESKKRPPYTLPWESFDTHARSFRAAADMLAEEFGIERQSEDFPGPFDKLLTSMGSVH